MLNEKIMILEMIKDGHISVDDGVKLLNAINKNSSSSFEEFASDLKYKINNMPKPDTTKIKQNTQSFFNKTEEIFDDLTKSVKDFFSSCNSDENENKNNQTNDNINTNIIDINEENNKNDDFDIFDENKIDENKN